MKIVQKCIYSILFASFFAASADQAIPQKHSLLESDLVIQIKASFSQYDIQQCMEDITGRYLSNSLTIDQYFSYVEYLLDHKKDLFVPTCQGWIYFLLKEFYTEKQTPALFTQLCKKYPEFLDAFINFAMNQFPFRTRYTLEGKGDLYLMHIILEHKDLCDLFFSRLGQNTTLQKIYLTPSIINEFSSKKYSLEHFFESAKKELLKPILHLIQEQKRLKEEFKKIVKNHAESVSSYHISKVEKYTRQKIKQSACFNQFIKALHKEKELTKQGYICFYHGQMRDYAVMSDLGNILFNELVQKQAQSDFYFMQFRKNDFDHVKQSITGQKKLPAVITEIKNEHISMLADRTEPYRHPWRLSLNIFAFGNCNNWGSNTFNFVETNSNINESKNIFKLNCDNFNIPETISLKYETRMRDLIQKYNTLYSTGRLILFAFPATMVDAYAYIASVGAYRYKPYLENRYIESVTDLLTVVQKQNITFYDLDSLEFATPLTPAGALNPYRGIKLFVFENEQCDKQLEQQLHAERQTLINDLIADLKQQNLLSECQRIAKEFDKLLKMCA